MCVTLHTNNKQIRPPTRFTYMLASKNKTVTHCSCFNSHGQWTIRFSGSLHLYTDFEQMNRNASCVLKGMWTINESPWSSSHIHFMWRQEWKWMMFLETLRNNEQIMLILFENTRRLKSRLLVNDVPDNSREKWTNHFDVLHLYPHLKEKYRSS